MQGKNTSRIMLRANGSFIPDDMVLSAVRAAGHHMSIIYSVSYQIQLLGAVS